MVTRTPPEFFQPSIPVFDGTIFCVEQKFFAAVMKFMLELVVLIRRIICFFGVVLSRQVICASFPATSFPDKLFVLRELRGRSKGLTRSSEGVRDGTRCTDTKSL